MIPLTKIILKDSQEDEYKAKVLALNDTFVKTIENCFNYSIYDYQNLSNIVSFVQNSTDIYNTTNIQKNVIMLVGPSGSGKSTLLDYISGAEMLVENDSKGLALYPKDPSTAPSVVGNGSGSTTFIPNLYSPTTLDGFQDTTFADCPGDFDTNGPLFEILNENAKMKICNASENLKVLLVVSHSSLGSAGSYGVIFKQTAEKLEKLLGDKAENIFMVVTHASRNPHIMDQVTTDLNNILKQPTTSGIDDFKPILQQIISNKRFTCFCNPSEEAEDGSDYSPPSFSSVDLSRDALLQSIRGLAFKNVKGTTFSVSSSPNIQKMIDGYVNGTQVLLGAISIVNQKVIQSLNAYIDLINHQRVQVDISKLNDLLDKLTDICNTNDQKVSLFDYSKLLISKINACSYLPLINESEMNEILNCLSFYSLFSSNPIQIHPNSSWKTSILLTNLYSSFNNDIQSLMKPNLNTQDNKIFYHGYDIKLSDISSSVKSGVSDIQVVALNSIIIDCDITCPSANFSIYSPKWFIPSTAKFDLSSSPNTTKVEPSQGYQAQGNPGLAGYGGGNFYGVGEQFDKPFNLKIISQGGQGGQGGDGTQGKPAISGQRISINTHDGAVGYADPDIARTKIESMNRDSEITSSYLLNFFNKYWFTNNSPLSFVLRTYQEGNKFQSDFVSRFDYINFHVDVTRINYGEDGGIGGQGGIGGLAGQIVILDLSTNSNISSQFSCETSQGAQGVNGTQGRGGNQSLSLANVTICFSHNRGAIYTSDGIASATIRVNSSSDCSTGDSADPNNSLFNNNNQPQPTPHPNNAISSKENYISFIFQQNASFKQIDILSSQFVKNEINNNASGPNLDEIISRLFAFENNFSQKNNQDAIQCFYQQLQKDLISVAGSLTSEDPNIQTIKYLYQLMCTGISRLKTFNDSCVVIDMKVFLQSISQNISILQELKKMDTIKVYQSNYTNNIQAKITEATGFIKTLQNNITQSENEIIDNVNTIIDKISKLVDDAEKENQEYQDEIKQLKSNLIGREIVSGISTICAGISIFIPQVAYVGKAVDKIGGVVIPNDPNVPLKEKAPEGLVNLDNFKISVSQQKQVDANQNIKDTLLTLETTQAIEKFKQTAKPGDVFTAPNNSSLSISDRILKLQQNSDVNNGDEQQQIALVNLKNELNQPTPDPTNIEKAKALVSSLQAKFGSLSQQKVDTGVQVAKNINSMVKDYQVTKSKIATLEDAIEANNQQIEVYQQNINSLSDFQGQQFDQITSYISTFEQTLQNESSASLDMSQFQMDAYIQKLQDTFSTFPEQDSSCSLANTTKLLSQAIDQIIKIYQRIQTYQDQSNFANYIADVSTVNPLANIPQDYQERVEKVLQLTTRNIIMEQYNTALTSFSQWAFPFNSYYLGTSKCSLVGPDSNTFTDQSSMISEIQQSISSLEQIIDISSSTISQNTGSSSPDKNFKTADFGNPTSQYPPFFIWSYCDYPNEIDSLLQGQPITLIADVSLSKYDVVKFNAINLTCKIPDDANGSALNNQLQDLLVKFEVILTHSGASDYRFNNNIYRINSTNSGGIQVAFDYDNTPDSTIAYQKLKNSKPLLSPYTTWTIQLKPIDPTQNSLFTSLSKFTNKNVNVFINGYGQYFDHTSNETPFPIGSDYFYSQVDNSIIGQQTNSTNTLGKVLSKKILGKLKTTSRGDNEKVVVKENNVVTKSQEVSKMEPPIPAVAVVKNTPITLEPVKPVVVMENIIPVNQTKSELKKSIFDKVSIFEKLTKESKQTIPTKPVAPKRSLSQLP